MAAVDGLTTKSQLYEFDGFQSFTMSLHSKDTRRREIYIVESM